VVCTGERLPDGTTADAVCLLLNEPYWEGLNSAPTRPLDYADLKADLQDCPMPSARSGGLLGTAAGPYRGGAGQEGGESQPGARAARPPGWPGGGG